MTAGFGDFHSHLVPGVDDGSRTLDDSLHSIERMVNAGVTQVITTPHYAASIADRYDFDATMDHLDRRWELLQDAVARDHPRLDFRRGFEVRLDAAIPDLGDPRLPLGGTDFVLIEWPMFMAPPGAPELIARVIEGGHRPIVAHPERYGGIDAELGAVRAWKQAGAYLQGNYGSLVGQNGTVARRLILRMLSEGLLDYLSSDFHGRPEYTFYLERGAAELARLGAHEHLDLLGRVNPGRLFDGKPPLGVPPLALKALAGRTRQGSPG